MKQTSITHKQKLLAFIAIYAFAILFLVSPDSYTHDLFNRADSSIFFMCGKAWMNGMLPYVDYTDSKGPLFWLIYGVGYLLSHYDYIGVFWLSVLLYFGVFYLVYKTAHLFLNNDRLSLLAMLLMTFSFFNPWYHYEIRCEDWCQIFLVLSVYRVCLHLYGGVSDKRSLYLTAYLLGISFAGPLLIKYSIAIMMGTIMCYGLYFYIREKHNVVMPLLLFLAGCATIIAPLALVFYLQGTLSACIEEYFLNTFKTIQESNSSATYLHELFNILANPAEAVLFAISLAGCLFFSRSVRKYKYFPLLTLLGFWLITIHHGADYYFSICTLFTLWFVIAVLQEYGQRLLASRKIRLGWLSVAILAFCTVWNYTFTQGFLLRNLFFYDNENRTDYYNLAYLMSQVEEPTVIYMHFSVSHGEGTPVGVMPGSKYYFSQLGATPEMEALQREDVSKGHSDFVIIDRDQLTEAEEMLLAEGKYHKCYEYPFWYHHYDVYSKHQLRMPPTDFHMSNMDILLKRNPFK